jgi:VanZ family protein
MKKKIIWWVLITFWCGFIFFQSHQPDYISSMESNIIVDILNKLLAPLGGVKDVSFTSFVVRKCAHFIEYFILGILLFMGFKDINRLKQTFSISLLLGVIYAATDEIHQYFIPGRAMSIKDVFIDSLGVLTGLCLLVFTAKGKTRV